MVNAKTCSRVSTLALVVVAEFAADVKRTVKRALRAIQSPAYEKARKKNPLLPAITDRASLENTFKLLPLSMLALRVVKTEAHNHGKKAKRVKGQWTVKIEREQEAKDEMYYVWLWEGSQIKRQLYAALALVLIFAVVLYPLWPLVLRKGVYHLSWGLMGLLVAFFGMAIFRVILFCITYFILSPGFWLFPNLWEDVGFFDSFKPVWAWHEVSIPHCLVAWFELTCIDRQTQEEEVEGRGWSPFRNYCRIRGCNRPACTCNGHYDRNRHSDQHWRRRCVA